MYYKLNEKYAFRGWDRLPFAIRVMQGDTTLGRPLFMDKKAFMIALRCNGVEDVDYDALDEQEKRAIDELLRSGLISSSEEPMGSLASYQRYHVYKGTYLESIHWSITGACNYRCRHCLVSTPRAKHTELPLEDLVKIADQIAECGIRQVDLTGGEPLVRKDFMDLVRELSKRRIAIRTIFTNTKLLTGELLDELLEAGQRPGFQISYDGWGTHDWLRNVKGAEDEAKAACELFKERGIGYGVAACVHKGNKGALRPLWRYLADHGCISLNVNSPQELGDWSSYAEEYAYSQEELWEEYQQVIRDWYEDGMPIDLNLDGFFNGKKGQLAWRVMYASHVDESREIGKIPYCESVRHGGHVSAEGRIMPCMGFADTALADSFPCLIDGDITLGEASSNPESTYFKVQRTTVGDMINDAAENPECADCEHLRNCLGGCMLEGTTPEGNHLHRDERACWFFKNVGEEGVRAVCEKAIADFIPDGLAKLQAEREESAKKPQMESLYGGDLKC